MSQGNPTQHEYKYSIKQISDLIPYINNSRTHSDEQVNQIASSIKEFGFTNPVLIDEQGGLIAGHGRVLAARKLGLANIPSITLEGLTEAQKKAYIIADNQLPLNAGWDLDKLKLEIDTLKEMDFDIDLLRFDDDFLDRLLSDRASQDSILKDESYSEVFNIVVECVDELDQESIYHDLVKKGYKCQVQSL